MKIGRILLLAFLLVLFLFFPYKPLQFLSALILISGLLAWIYSKSTRENLSVRRTTRELRVPRFEELEISFSIENRSFLPIRCCYIADGPGLLSTDGTERVLVSIGGRERLVVKYRVTGFERGEYVIGPIKIRAADPLGLFPFERIFEDRCTVMVYPARRRLEVSPEEGIPQGVLQVADVRYEDLTRYRSVREYVRGDERRRINWKASARLGSLCTNEYHFTMNCPFFVFLNLCFADYPLKRRFRLAEAAIETAAALALFASQRRQSCGFASSGILVDRGVSARYDESAEPKADESEPFISLPVRQEQSEVILDVLARIALRGGTLASWRFLERMSVSLPAGSLFFYVGPALNEKDFRQILNVKPAGVRVEAFFTPGASPKEREEVWAGYRVRTRAIEEERT